MRPLVALPARYSDTAEGWRVPAFATGRPYCEAIVRAGGTPVVLPPLVDTIDSLYDTLSRFDALVLTGGPDVDPDRYGVSERHPTLYGVRDEHDEWELALVRVAMELDLPMLAICRGFQVMNVALGGTLHQHITDDESDVNHRFEMHPVSLEASSRTALAMGTVTPVGHSVHHQALDRIGDGLTVIAHADDGTVEAAEVDGRRWAVGVQWHPEDTAHDDPAQQGLFDELIRQALARRA